MGNTVTKILNIKADWIDGGRVREKIPHEERQVIMWDAWGAPIYAPKEYDASLVKKLIRRRRLAPFYSGTEGVEEGGDESGDSFDETSTSTATTTKMKRFKYKKNQTNKDDPESVEASFFDPKLLETDLVDCPICLLAYPRNINYTECCHQPICTLCFIKIKRPASGRVITCPFCNHVNFGVCYHKPRWLGELQKEPELRDEGIKPDPVACEAVKIIVPPHERQRPRPQLQQQPRYYYSRGGTGTVPRRYVFYEPSGSYTFYDNQYYHRRDTAAGNVDPTQAQSQVQTQSQSQSQAQTVTPSYYQHYQQQEYQRQQALRSRAEEYERLQLDEAIRRSMSESTEAADEYAARPTKA